MEPGRDAAELLDHDRDRRRLPLPRWSRWLLVLLAGVLVAVAVGRSGPAGPVRAAPSRSPAAPSGSPAPSPSSGPPSVLTLGRPLLGVTAGWELFARGAEEVVRIEPARGRITRTVVPALLSSGPFSFVVTPHLALVRSIDLVPGYVVPDGQPARRLPAALGSTGGMVFPGPQPGTVWVESDALLLRSVADGRLLATVRSPEPSTEVLPDGAGRLVFLATGGAYASTPAGLRRITTGALLAAGPTGWLVLDCDDAHRCRPFLVDRASWTRRAVPAALPADVPRGVLAPDGRTAALFRVRRDGSVVPYLLDLASGATQSLGLQLEEPNGSSLVWSPDSRWLFTTVAGGMVTAVDPRTGRGTALDVTLLAPTALAVRPAP